MNSEYIEQRNGGYYVKSTRISLDSVVYAFNNGESPEVILEQFPLLENLARIYGAIAFYLDRKEEIDEYLVKTQREFAASTIPLEIDSPSLWKKIQAVQAKAAEPAL